MKGIEWNGIGAGREEGTKGKKIAKATQILEVSTVFINQIKTNQNVID